MQLNFTLLIFFSESSGFCGSAGSFFSASTDVDANSFLVTPKFLTTLPIVTYRLKLNIFLQRRLKFGLDNFVNKALAR